jgi:hypothetical protein
MELTAYLQEVTDRVVKQVLHEDASDAAVVDRPLEIEMPFERSSNSAIPENAQDRQSKSVGTSAKPKKSKKTKKRKKKKKQRR